MLSLSKLQPLGQQRERSVWLKRVIIVGVLGISAVFALFFSEARMTLVLLGLAGVVAGLIFVRWPPVGILVAVLSGLLIPYNGPSGFNATLLIVAFLLGLWIVELLISRGPLNVFPSRTLWLSLAFIAVAVLSLGVGQLNWYSFGIHAPFGAQAGGAAIYILSIAAFLLAANRIGTVQWLERITWAFLAVSGVIIVLRVIPETSVWSANYISPPGAVFWIWAAGLAFGQAVLNRKLHPVLRIVLVVLTLLIIYHLYFQRYQNKSGWVTVFICLAGVIGSRSIKYSLLIGFILITAVLSFNLITNTVGSEEYSFSTRIEAGELLVQMIRVNPILGVGFANSYWYASLFPIRGWDVQFSSHNNYLDIWLQTGLIGLLIYGLLMAEISILLLRLRNRVPVFGFAEGYLHGAMGAFTGMVVAGALADWVMPFFYNIGMHGFRHSVIGWLFLGGIIVLDKAFPSQSKASKLETGYENQPSVEQKIPL